MATLEEVRLANLVGQLLSPSVQVPVPEIVQEVPAMLSDDEVAKTFVKYVPGVSEFLFRGHPGQYSLKFLQTAYLDGMRAFEGTPLHDHLMWLMRLTVHHARDGKPNAAHYLTEVAEAFMDCQAVQARAVERVGLQICGVAPDFRGLLTTLIGEYKTLAVKALAVERLAHGDAQDYDAVPTHYENRLTEDLGALLGLNADDVRRAALDGHAQARFAHLTDEEARAAAARCRELFDVRALLQAFCAEIGTLNSESPQESLPRRFMEWAAANITPKHVVLDEATCSRVEIGDALALVVFEKVFFGKPSAPPCEHYRGVPVLQLIQPAAQATADIGDAAPAVGGSVGAVARAPARPHRRALALPRHKRTSHASGKRKRGKKAHVEAAPPYASPARGLKKLAATLPAVLLKPVLCAMSVALLAGGTTAKCLVAMLVFPTCRVARQTQRMCLTCQGWSLWSSL